MRICFGIARGLRFGQLIASPAVLAMQGNVGVATAAAFLPMFFERLRLGRPILVPAEGFPFVHLVHIEDVARCLASVVGNERAAGEAYNVSGDEVTSVLGCIRMMAKAAGVEPDIVHVPLAVARRARPPLVHWGEALVGGAIFANDKAKADLDWAPQLGLEAAYADSYAWWEADGRGLYEYDFSADDAVLADLPRG